MDDKKSRQIAQMTYFFGSVIFMNLFFLGLIFLVFIFLGIPENAWAEPPCHVHIRVHSLGDVLTSLKLFDSLIKPIITYNCEFWNQLTKNKIESLESNKTTLEESYFDAPAEQLHLQFCRTTLGVSNKTSSLAVLGELGRYPLMLNCYVQMIKY